MEVIMPNKDGTGPSGLGPFTGKRFGNCNGTTNKANFFNGWGMGSLFGQGNKMSRQGENRMGWNKFLISITPDIKLSGLEKQAKFYQKALENVTNRINNLKQE
jgi:hypothetical protein